MKKILFTLIASISLMFVFSLASTTKVEAWGGDDHPKILDKALDILYNDKKQDEYYFYTSNQTHFDQLSKGSLDPDKDESIGGTHYYVYEGTPTSVGSYYKNNNGNYSRSARTRLEEHYTAALNQYMSGEEELAFNSLGRAIHYISDIGAAPHASGVKSSDASCRPHNKYETWVAQRTDTTQSFHATSSNRYYDDLNDSFEEITNYLASISGVYKDELLSCTDNDYMSMTQKTMPLTEKIVAGILNRFYQDVHSSTRYPYYIKDGGVYYIKNLKSGLYMDVKGWGTSNNTDVHQYTFHGDNNQKFIAHMNDDGTFSFYPVHAPSKALKMVSKLFDNDKMVIYTIDSDDDAQKFKPVYVQNGYYRIMTGKTNFAEIVRVESPWLEIRSKVGGLAYNPESLNHYWYFEEVNEIGNKPYNAIEKDHMPLKFREGEKKYIEFSPTVTGYYNLETFGTKDTYFKVYSREGTNNSNITLVHDGRTSDDAGNGRNAKISLYLQSGKKYIVQLKLYFSSDEGHTTFTLIKNGYSTLGSVPVKKYVYLSSEENEYYAFTPTEDNTFIIETTGSYDTYLYLYDSNFVEIDKNDDYTYGDYNAKIVIKLEAYKTYYIRVRMYSSYRYGSFYLEIDSLYKSI